MTHEWAVGVETFNKEGRWASVRHAIQAQEHSHDGIWRKNVPWQREQPVHRLSNEDVPGLFTEQQSAQYG